MKKIELRAGCQFGVDVSKWQGDVDWKLVSEYGASFACCKATEATKGVDNTFEKNKKGVRTAGIRFGAYHFCRPDMDKGDAYDEAKHFYSVVGPLDVTDLPPAVDIEVASSNMSGGDVLKWTNDFSAACEELFKRKIISYAYPFFWPGLRVTPSGLIAERDLWIAHYGVKNPIVPKPWTNWKFWQYSGDVGEAVPGVKGACDRNWFNGSLEDLDAWILSTSGSEPSNNNLLYTPLDEEMSQNFDVTIEIGDKQFEYTCAPKREF